MCLCFFSYTAACGPRSVRTATVRVRFSEAGEVSLGLSADPAALSRGGRTGTCRFTAREPVTVCRHNLGGRPEAGAVAVAARQTAGRRSPVEPPISRSRSGRRSPVGRLPAAHRSGRVSGIRPSDRRGPGPVGHRGRNVRSTGRCSYNLRITRRRADSCGLHRSTSQVIRRSGSGVFFVCRRNFCATRARGARSFDGNHLSVDAWSGVAARGRSAS